MDIKQLLSQMSVREKVGQLQQLAAFFYQDKGEGQITGPLTQFGLEEEDVWNSGSVLGVYEAHTMIEIQKKYLERNKHGIPLLFMSDVIHGHRTTFPVSIGLSCSWDLSAMEESARIAAKESAVSGIHVTFAPMVDLVRDPRWGRVVESTGEDHVLNGWFAQAFVRGFQGDLSDKYQVATCVKHFAAYGLSEGGRDYNTVDLSDRTLREYYLPPYKAALDAGCKMVMTSFNTVHGIPSSGNAYLMRDILRDEFKFDGVVISDWGAVGELIPHGVARDGREAAKLGLLAGTDVEMMTPHYMNHAQALIESGEVSESLLDEAVLRVLQLKADLGLFENPYRAVSVEECEEVLLCASHREKSREIAGKSMVLLKNEGVLPLKREQKVALVGPYAQSQMILGPWSHPGRPEDSISLSVGLGEKTDNLMVATDCSFDVEASYIAQAVEVAKEADVIVLALGEHQNLSGEAGCRTDITLPGLQMELVKALSVLGKPMVAVLLNGRPLQLGSLNELADSILEAWFPGMEGGRAIADVLYGDVNPQGKLTMSFPRAVGQIPVYYNHYKTGRPVKEDGTKGRFFSQYLDCPNSPLYPFGYGLSYTTYEYGKLTLSQRTMCKGEVIQASVSVKNTGQLAGTEIVQLYIRDLVGQTVRPVKELKGFELVELQPGESKVVTFEVSEDMLAYHHFNGTLSADLGEFEVMVGPSSAHVQILTFELV